ncbi:MAG: CDP-alcohol phosphatidyltransferase family protein [Oscillospiraceae bacterium]|nr:CDP-alcohol phosphatidyltransferase family protein [Oscillospiraceae bacterium]
MRHIPNILSAFRIILIPFLVYLVVEGEMFQAALLLILSGITDLVDGFLARRFGWVSRVGKVLDPMADKLTQITVCVLFAVVLGGRFWIFFGFLVFKEAVMLGLGAYLWRKGVKIEGSRWFGKVTTVLFYLSVIVIALWPGLPDWAAYGLLGVTSLVALFAGLKYIPDFRGYRQQAEEIS